MKKYTAYILALFASALFVLSSCKDDDIVDGGEYNSERLFMPMFRVEANTNDSSDPYACTIASNAIHSTSNRINDVQLYWYGVEGASGYRIRCKVQGTDWDRNSVLDTIVGPEVLELLHEDLQYSVGYSYAIQALSPKGDAYNSKWYGMGDGSHQKDYVTITTGDRYEVPSIFWVEDVTFKSVRVYFNNTVESTSEYEEFINSGAEIVDGKWVFHDIQIVPTADNPDLESFYHTMTEEDFANGYVDFDGLVSNGSYIVTGNNNNVPRVYDRNYNKAFIRMLGEVGAPIAIPAIYDAGDTIMAAYYNTDGLQASRLDTILTNYMGDNTITEGQVFYLEGGKNYYLASSVALTKGLTLETNPEDLAAGKGRALVYLGVGTSDESGNSGRAANFNLGRNAQSGAENGVLLSFQDIKFNEINFTVQKFFNYMDKNGTGGNSNYAISANYFMNMNSQGLGFTMGELSITNCTFSGMIRGFIRFQGPNRQIIQRLTVEGCVFYDCGVYDANGRGYAWFAGPGDRKDSNFFQNLTIRNNSFIDCPRHSLVGENGNLAWPAGTTWNIVIENNTFVNFSTRSSNSGHGLILETRYAPRGSKFTVKKNLFVMVRQNDSDNRPLNMKGMRIDTKAIEYDFADNYATTVPNWTTSNLIDGLFSNRAFSNTSDGAGYNSGALNLGGYGETRIKFGDNRNENEDDAVGYQLAPAELFMNPVPLAPNGHKDMHRYNVDGFYYNLTPRVMAHPIYTKGIGDPRWRNGDAWK